MNMIKVTVHYYRWLMLIIALVFLYGCKPQPVGNEPWTLMVYMGANDTQLASYAEQNLQDLLNAPRNPRVQILVQIERQGEAERWRIRENEEPIPEIVQGANVADSEQLTAFLSWAKTMSQGHRRALVLWGHGDGWDQDIWQPEVVERVRSISPRGLFGGNTADGKRAMLPNHRISQAIHDANLELDVLGFDGCTMATLETLYEFSDNADYLVASQHLVPLQGWNYFGLLTAMNQEHPQNVQMLINQVLQAYREKYRQLPGTWSLSAFSAAGIDAAHQALNMWSVNQLEEETSADNISLLRSVRPTAELAEVNTINPSIYVDMQQLFAPTALDVPDVISALKLARAGYWANASAGQQGVNGLSLVFYQMPEAADNNILNQNYRMFDAATGIGSRGEFFSANAWPDVFWRYAEAFP